MISIIENYSLSVTIALLLFSTMASAFSAGGGSKNNNLFVGVDLGTSGARVSIIEKNDSSSLYTEVYTDSILWSQEDAYDDPDAWVRAVETLIQGAGADDASILSRVASICISGTSASCLLMDRKTLEMSRPARMYNFDVVTAGSGTFGTRAMQLVDKHAPPKHTARAATGSLAKLVAWALETPLTSNEVLCHQSDYVSAKFLGTASPVTSDWHNCLKLGYDVRNQEWPKWIEACLKDAGIEDPLGGDGVIPTKVISPGLEMGTICSAMSQKLGLSKDVKIVGGTTDSNAAFFAAAGTTPVMGTAVTSLGSTLAMKQLSPTYVEDADRGVYSHRFPTFSNDDENNEAWLVGGASNVGCAVFRQLGFSNEELKELSQEIDPSTDSELSYYPLTKTGERFPVADSNKSPVLEPVPTSRKEYLHGLLQSIGDVERDGFKVLQELGSQPPSTVYTCGGGSQNPTWSQMRERRLSSAFGSIITVRKAECTEASVGAAFLAAATFSKLS